MASSALLDCPSCDSPLAELVDEVPVREAVWPALDREEAVAAISGATVVEERAGLVWLPVWLVRCRHARNLYEAALDGMRGTVLRARAPMERSTLLHEAIFFTCVFAFVFGMPLSW